MPRVPSFRRHTLGNWMCFWGGKSHYFSQVESVARHQYADSLKDWAAWRESRATGATPARGISCEELVNQFLDEKERERGTAARSYYEKHLKRFLWAYADVRADLFRVKHLQGIKTDMLHKKFAAKTVNHDLVAIRGLFGWAQDLEIIPPIRLRGAKNLSLGPPPNKAIDFDVMRAFLAAAPNPVRPWLVINYLCLMRPSEVVRVVLGQGEWIEAGVFRLHRGKMDERTRLARHVIFSPLALKWLSYCEPAWSRLDSYSAAARRHVAPYGPGRLRHSAASHLIQAGVDRASVTLLLGHAPARVSLIYAQVAWQPLRAISTRLTLRRDGPLPCPA